MAAPLPQALRVLPGEQPSARGLAERGPAAGEGRPSEQRRRDPHMPRASRSPRRPPGPPCGAGALSEAGGGVGGGAADVTPEKLSFLPVSTAL